MVSLSDMPEDVLELISSFWHLMLTNKLFTRMTFENFAPNIIIDFNNYTLGYTKFKNINKIKFKGFINVWKYNNLKLKNISIFDSILPYNINKFKNLKTLKLEQIPESCEITAISGIDSLEELYVVNYFLEVYDLPKLKKCRFYLKTGFREEAWHVPICYTIRNLPSLLSFRFWMEKKYRAEFRFENNRDREYFGIGFSFISINENIEELICEEICCDSNKVYLPQVLPYQKFLNLKKMRFAIPMNYLPFFSEKLDLSDTEDYESDNYDSDDSEIIYPHRFHQIFIKRHEWNYKKALSDGVTYVCFG